LYKISKCFILLSKIYIFNEDYESALSALNHAIKASFKQILFQVQEIYYGVFIGGENDLIISINKLGYCVNSNQGINYPIYITFEDGAEETFYIRKTGIFEFQPEEWMDVNDDKIKRTATVSVKRILVPDNIPFVLDYCFVV
jgi:hypothetical protein